MTRTNEHGQPVGDPVAWTPAPALTPVRLDGRWVALEPLAREHADDLARTVCAPEHDALWTYAASERPQDVAAYVERRAADPAVVTLAIRPRGGPVAGLASWMREDRAHGSVEVGGIVLGPLLQRTTAATEAMWLMARHAFDRGYRRYEWKCDALNVPSRAAAARLGFRYEGTFRQALVVKGRNRDTAWFALTDADWRALRPAYEAWLAPANFDDPETGRRQRTSLSDGTRSHDGTRFPHVETPGTLA